MICLRLSDIVSFRMDIVSIAQDLPLDRSIPPNDPALHDPGHAAPQLHPAQGDPGYDPVRAHLPAPNMLIKQSAVPVRKTDFKARD